MNARTIVPELPAGFTFRRPRTEDAPAVLELMIASDIAETGEADSSIEDVEETWNLPRFDRDRDAWLVTGPGRRLAAYAWVWDRKPHVELQADCYVHPEFRGAGVEDPVLHQLEARGAEHRTAAPRGEEVRLRLFTAPIDQERVALFERRGYERIRTYQRMSIDLRAGLGEARWPEGIVPRPFRPGRDDRAVQEAIQESFADHFAHVHESHDDWIRRRTQQSNFDPSIWTVAWDGPEAAGAALNYVFDDLGWVRELGVRAAWRGRGIGRALLLHTFALFHARGLAKASLGVDSANATGAIRLYESVGMHVALRHDLYEKRLGPGQAS